MNGERRTASAAATVRSETSSRNDAAAGAGDRLGDARARALGVKEVEPLATALFLRRERPEATDETLAARLHEIKPHGSVDVARVALQKGGRWMAERA
jgi:hypothetical protein